MPDRHIFRVGSDGEAEVTGRTAPREPIRSIAPWNRRSTPPAVEPPPPSLSVPEEPAKVTKPARRRRTPSRAAAIVGELEASGVVALAPAEASTETAKPNRGRKKNGATSTRKKASAGAAGRKKSE